MQSENLLSCHTLVRWCIGIVKSLLFESRKQIDVNTCLFSLLGVIEMVYLNVSVLRHNALSYSLNRISPLQIVAFVVVIVWWLDLKLPVQSVPIITKVVNSNPDHCEVFLVPDTTLCDKFVRDLRQVSGFLGVLRFPPPIKLTTTK